MCYAPKAFISWVERPLIFSLSSQRPSYLFKEWRFPSRRVEKMKRRSTQDMIALGAQRIKGVFFFQPKAFWMEYMFCFLNHLIGGTYLQYDTVALVARPKCEILLNSDHNWKFLIFFFWVGGGDRRYPSKFCNLKLLTALEGEGSLQNCVARKYYQLKTFMFGVRVKFYWNPIIIEDFRI